MKQKTKDIIIGVFEGVWQVMVNVLILLMFTSFFLVFLNSNIEYFRELPTLLKATLPFGFLIITFKIMITDWFAGCKK